MPTLPLLHGCLRIHAMTAAPSLASAGWKKSKVPEEQPVPRRLTPM